MSQKASKMGKGLFWAFAISVAIGVACVYWVVVLRESLMPYKTFAEVKHMKGTAQVYGTVVGECHLDEQGCIEFVMEDKSKQRAIVRYCGIPPVGLDSGKEVVAIGEFIGDAFVAQRLLTKCPSRYKTDEADERSSRY